ncbi:glucose-6-phosphate dehydrogenase [Frateuria aurantia]
MNSSSLQVEAFDLVIFGGTGDLSIRKLLPAMFHRFVDGQIDPASRIIGIARADLNDESFRSTVQDAISQASKDAKAKDIKAFLQMIHYRSLDASKDAGWEEFASFIGEQAEHIRVFYLSTSPSLFSSLCKRLGDHKLNEGKARVVLEKPIGTDLASANKINDDVAKVFHESQTYRIDHYLGKETVQNLLALRFGNALFEPLWNAGHIEHVQITVAETVGVGHRAGYYDGSGAMRDMIQNHILQLLCMLAMEPPASLEPDAVRDEKLKVLRSLKPITAAEASQNTVRGQYRAGASEGGSVPGYQDELGRASNTETFVAIKAEIANWRWAGVPFYLRTGKRLPERLSEIVVTFKEVPHSIFGQEAGTLAQNRLVLRLQPDEGVKLWLTIKNPGPGGLKLRHVPLDMSFLEAFGIRQLPDAYERLILDVVRGNPTLFMRRDEVEAAWNWADPILDAWAASGDAPKLYTAGTWGPSASVALIERDGHTWNEDNT